MGQTYYFLNYQRDNQLEDKCPKCGEEFTLPRGAGCQTSKCEDKQLEQRHKEVIKPMVRHCLPKYNVEVFCPIDIPLTKEVWETNKLKWGESNVVGKKITIPWFTLRSKRKFFNTTAHEAGHILAYEQRFKEGEKKIIQQLYNLIEEYNSLPSLVKYSQIGENYRVQATNFYQKHKKIIDKYNDPQSRKLKQLPKWTHDQSSYSSYVECFNFLLNSPYAWCNYDNSPYPRPFDLFSQ